MTDSDERAQYGPIRRGSIGIEPAHRLPFDISSLSVTGLVIICELDDPPPGNSRPSMSMKMTQYLRLSDESMIRLDMDRGMSSFKLGRIEVISRKRSAADMISEVLTLVQADATEPDSFPWEQYAEDDSTLRLIQRFQQISKYHFEVVHSPQLYSRRETRKYGVTKLQSYRALLRYAS